MNRGKVSSYTDDKGRKRWRCRVDLDWLDGVVGCAGHDGGRQESFLVTIGAAPRVPEASEREDFAVSAMDVDRILDAVLRWSIRRTSRLRRCIGVVSTADRACCSMPLFRIGR